MDRIPDELVDSIVVLSWDCSGLVALVSKQLHASVCRTSLSRKRRANIKCLFFSRSCFAYALNNRQASLMLLERATRERGACYVYTSTAKRLALAHAPPELVLSIYNGSLGHVSCVFDMVKFARVDLLTTQTGEDSFLSQALGSLRIGHGGDSFELKCNLILPACSAPSTASLELLESWARDVSGGDRHFDSTFSFMNTCSTSAVSSAASSVNASSVLDFVVERMARFDGIPAKTAEAQVIASMCSMGRIVLSESAWKWLQARTSNLKDTIDLAMLNARVAQAHKSKWLWDDKFFLCKDVRCYRIVRSGISGWLKDAYNKCVFRGDSLATHTLYAWYTKWSHSKLGRKPVERSMLNVLEECAFDAVQDFLCSKRKSCLALMHSLRGLMHASTLSMYRVCERLACEPGDNREKVDNFLYTHGFATDVLLRLASLRNDIALDRAAKWVNHLLLGREYRERLLQVCVFRGDTRSAAAVLPLCKTASLKNLVLASEYGDAAMFSFLLKTYDICYRTDIGSIALNSGYASIVQCALDFRCFLRGSPEEKRAFGMISVGDAGVIPKRKLPWSGPESFEEGDPQP